MTFFFCLVDAVLSWDFWWFALLSVPCYFGIWHVSLKRRQHNTFALLSIAAGCCFFLLLCQPEITLVAVHPTHDEIIREIEKHPGLLICGGPSPWWWEFRLNIIPYYTRFVPGILKLWTGIILLTTLAILRRKTLNHKQTNKG